MYSSLQPRGREVGEAWAETEGRATTTQGPQDPPRTWKACVHMQVAAGPCPGLPDRTPKCSWPHFLQPWEVAGMRKTCEAQGGSGPGQAPTICPGHIASMQPTAQTVGGFSLSPPFGASSSLTLNV